MVPATLIDPEGDTHAGQGLLARAEEVFWLRAPALLFLAFSDVDSSRAVLGTVVFADPGKYTGKVIPVVRESISWPDVAKILTEVTGVQVRRACPLRITPGYRLSCTHCPGLCFRCKW